MPRPCLLLTKYRFSRIYTNDGSKFAGSIFNLSYFLKVTYTRLWKWGMNYYITSINENGKGIGKKVKVRKRPKKDKYL